MTLLAMQREFRAWLCDEDAAIAGRIAAPPLAGLYAYQNNYRAQLVACLEEGFARTRAWIGDTAFHTAVAIHIGRVPPHSWTLDAYGRDFPATLASLHPDDPEIAELAWLEWALAEAFVGPDTAVVLPAEAAGIDWDDVMLHFTPTLDHRPLATNAAAIWSALAGGDVPPTVERLAEPGALLVWRAGQVSHFRAVDQREIHALLLARAGMPFGALCDVIVASYGEREGVALAGALLGRWLGDGLISAIAD